MGLSSFPETEISVSGIVPSIMDSIQIRLRTFHVVRSETIWKISNSYCRHSVVSDHVKYYGKVVQTG